MLHVGISQYSLEQLVRIRRLRGAQARRDRLRRQSLRVRLPAPRTGPPSTASIHLITLLAASPLNPPSLTGTSPLIRTS